MPTESTVFVVDDDAAVRQGLAALLRAKGYAAEVFASADEFLAAMPAARPACLVVDIRMPGMSGLELQQAMKSRDPALPVVVVTGHGDVPAAVTALKAGAVDFLEKPFDAEALLAAVSQALRQARAAAAGARSDAGALAARVAGLTPREREVMNLVVAGQPNKVIAHRLSISLRTVEIHRARVMDKTGSKSLADLVRLAVELEAASAL